MSGPLPARNASIGIEPMVRLRAFSGDEGFGAAMGGGVAVDLGKAHQARIGRDPCWIDQMFGHIVISSEVAGSQGTTTAALRQSPCAVS
jgi:hypothetical protein